MAKLTKGGANRLKTVAAEFMELWQEERELQSQRRDVGERLTQMLKDSGLTGTPADEFHAVQLQVTTSKRPGKADIVGAFGDAGEAFWAGLAPKVSEYLTVINLKPE